MADSGTLTPAQSRAVAALLTERDVRSAAKASKVGERTLYRWLAEPPFRGALESAAEAAFADGVRRLSALTGEAVEALRDVLAGEGAATVKIRAAEVVLAKLPGLRELAALEARLEAIEQALKAGGLKGEPANTN